MKGYYLPLIKIQAIKEKNIPYGKEQICNPQKAAEIARRVIGSADKEYLLVIAVDTKMCPVSVEIVSIGTLNGTISSPREVFKHAVCSNAYGLLLIHNHPSGDTTASSEDWMVSRKMKKAGDILGIPLLDHVIVGDNGNFKSMAETKRWKEL